MSHDDSVDSLLIFDDNDIEAAREIDLQPIRQFEDPSSELIEMIDNRNQLPTPTESSSMLLISALRYISEMLFGSSNDAKIFFNTLLQELKIRDIIPSSYNMDFEYDHNYSIFRVLMRALVYSVNPKMVKSLFPDTNPDLGGKLCSQPTIRTENINSIINRSSFYHQNFIQLKNLGSGGFGTVYLTQNKVDMGNYAVKIIRKSKQDVEFLIREVVVLAKLTHPNVVRYYSSWIEFYCSDAENTQSSTDNSSYVIFQRSEDHQESETWSSELIDADKPSLMWSLFIQMELCGESLKNWLDARNSLAINFNEHDRINVVHVGDNHTIYLQLLQGIDYIHSMGVVHRDIKPGNIFLNPETLSVKIGDFGLARNVMYSDDDRGVLKLSKGVGTKIYTAPEVNKTTKYDNKCDIYSLGVVFYELFSVFCTDSDRITCLRSLRTRGPSGDFSKQWPRQAFSIRLMVSQEASRPTATELLSEVTSLEETDRLRNEIKRLNALLAQSKELIQNQAKKISDLEKSNSVFV